MKLIRCLLTENDCYRTKRTIKPKGVMVHSTGADNPNLRRYVQPVKGGDGDYAALLAQLGQNKNGNHWNRPGLDVCVHGFIGKLADGSIVEAPRGGVCGVFLPPYDENSSRVLIWNFREPVEAEQIEGIYVGGDYFPIQ